MYDFLKHVKTVFVAIALFFFVLFMTMLLVVGWIFGAKLTVKENAIPIGYVRWFKFYRL